MTLTLKIVNQFFCMTLRLMIIHNHTNQVWLKMVEQFRRYPPDKIRGTHEVIPIYILPPPYEGGGGIKREKGMREGGAGKGEWGRGP